MPLHIADVRGDVPRVAECIFYAAVAISIGLIRDGVNGGGAGLERAGISCIRIGHVQLKSSWHRLIYAVGVGHFQS